MCRRSAIVNSGHIAGSSSSSDGAWILERTLYRDVSHAYRSGLPATVVLTACQEFSAFGDFEIVLSSGPRGTLTFRQAIGK
jgi:hypothetical protein